MNITKRNSIKIMYLLFMIVTLFSACSKKEDGSDVIELHPTETTADVTSPLNIEVDTKKDAPQEAKDNLQDSNRSINSEWTNELTNQNKVNEDTENKDVENQGIANKDVENQDAENKDAVNKDAVNKDTKNKDTENKDATNKNTENKDIDPDVVSSGSSVDENDNQRSTTKRMIAIDAGHQSKGNYEKEPIGPGSKTTKPKVSSGTQGVSSGVAEYELSLIIAMKLKEELLSRGYEVFMIRESHDVNLSNRERAVMANDSEADLFIRIHADGSTDSSANGTSTLYPSKDNPFVSQLSKASHTLSQAIVDSICEYTGSENRGAIARDDMSGINWCAIPVSIIEMGFMSNKNEDKLMQTEEYQNKIVKGISDGIDHYYERTQ